MVVIVLGLDDHVHEMSDGEAGTNDNSNDKGNDDDNGEDPIFLLSQTSTISSSFKPNYLLFTNNAYGEKKIVRNIYGTVSSKITLMILYQIFQDKLKKSLH